MSAAEVEEKFCSLVDPIVPQGRSREIIDAVNQVEKIRNIDDLVQLLIVPATKPFKAVAGGKQR